MHARIEISDGDIAYAESILLPEGKRFDSERLEFIRNMGTIDLQAVPGSGKTTALMAKLLIIDRYLPLPNEQGVIVISHTNAAIDEIKEKIGRYCHHIFSYPNFVGTIQSFVNEFLTTPYFEQICWRTITRIDDDSYNERFSKFGNHYVTGLKKEDRNKALTWLNANPNVVVRWISNGGKLSLGLANGEPLNVKKPRGGKWSADEIKLVQDFILDFKRKILKNGYVRFDEAYVLAELYINNYPKIKELIQCRFGYCFVDEMQDMDETQYTILEEIFYNEGLSLTIFQRIGDKNQSIYNSENKRFWFDRPVCLRLEGSHRLTKEIAEVVKHFAVSPIEIVGQRILPREAIKPHLLVYDDSTIGRVIPFYESIIESMLISGAIVDHPNNKYRVIGWTEKTGAADGHIRLNSYRGAQGGERIKNPAKAKTIFDCLKNIDILDQDFSVIESEVVGAIVRLLQQEEVPDVDGSPFTKARLNANLQNYAPDFYDEHRLKLYLCCSSVASQSIPAACAAFNLIFEDLLAYFGIDKSNTVVYRSSKGSADLEPSTPDVRKERSRVEVQSVHSVKGETHTCTLYVETFYQKDVGGGNYESQRLARAFDFSPLAANPHEYVLQSMKMVYVGFSRPTHLLCFAVHADRSQSMITESVKDHWNIVQVK
jgi:hypothetical protein